MARPKYLTKTVRLIGPTQRETALAALAHAPIDPEHPLEMILREEKKTRKPDQNEAMWAGVLRDIAEQAWIKGRQYSAETWHEHYKRLYLPEDDDEELSILARDGYRKWDYTPRGERVLIGSTTRLTIRGMAQYTRQVEADGASMGVVFHAPPMRQAA